MKPNHLFRFLAVMIFIFLLAACRNDEDSPDVATPVEDTTQTQPTQTPVEQPTEVPQVEPTAVPVPTSDSGETPTPTDGGTDNSGGGEATQGTGGAATSHTVMEREWTHQIARCYGTSVTELIQANHLAHPGWIMAGEVWTIPNPGSTGQVLGPPCIIYYNAQQGDTLLSISRAYNVPIDVLTFINYGCYGYNAHYDYGYYPPVPTPYDDGGLYYYDYFEGYGYLGGCRYYSYPWLYIGDLLVIPVNAQNMGMR